MRSPSLSWFAALSLFAVNTLVLSSCERAHAGSPYPLQGIIEFDERDLAFEVSGRAVDVAVQQGQFVASGALLAKLDDALAKQVRELRASEVSAAEADLGLLQAGPRGEDLRASESEISALKAQEGVLEKTLARQRTLRAGAALSQSALDDTAAKLEQTSDRKRALEERLRGMRAGARSEEIASAAARLQGAKAALAAEDIRLAHYALHSPAPGSVIEIDLHTGEMVAPGAPVITLADLDHPYVDVFVPQAQAPQLRVGQDLQVSVDGLSTPLPGRVERVFPKLEFTPRFLFSEGERSKLVLRVRIRIADPKHRLHGGLPASVGP